MKECVLRLGGQALVLALALGALAAGPLWIGVLGCCSALLALGVTDGSGA